MKRQASSIISLIIAIFLIPLPASAEPVCEGNNCTITFGYTGSMQSWEVPQGAINISFEAFGASGARGGAGGSVTGRLIDSPQTLYIFVGGAGSEGASAAGGYNGGGRAGGNRGNEGSGGGATDIRISTALEDRIVVAGGGGGAGGYAGAAGAPGGGLTANSGSSGQGGGGGGGSSFAASSQTENVEHQIGVNTGHGRLLLTYSVAPTVVSFTGVQVSASSATFIIEMSGPIADLTAEHLEVSSQSCEVGMITKENHIASIQLTGCSDGMITVNLLEFSVDTQASEASSLATATVDFDATGPRFSWQLIPADISTSETTIPFSVSDDVELLPSSFGVENCSLTVTESAVVLTSCRDGQVAVWLEEFTLFDSWGNAGPLSTQSVSFVVDTLAPVASWSEVVTSGDGPFSYSTTLNFSEPVSFSPELVTFFSEQECDVQSSEAPLGWLFEASCGYGSGSWALDTSELTDALGNKGDQGVVLASFSHLESIASEPEPEPEPAPEVVVTPPAPAPTPAPLPPPSEPVAPEPEQVIDPEPVEEVAEPEEVVPGMSGESATSSEQATEIPTASPEVDEVAQIEAELEREISTQPIPAPSKSSEAEETATQVVEPEQASEPATESESVSSAVLPVQPPALAEQVLFNDEPDPQPFPWFFALGAGLLLAAGVAALRLIGR